MIFKNKPTECIICLKSLGHDSREEGHIFCHEHRKCSLCNEQLTARESQLCYDTYSESLRRENITLARDHEDLVEFNASNIDVECVRCKGTKHSPTIAIKQSEFDYLNMIRLMIIPDMNLSVVTNENNAWIQSSKLIQNMTLEQKLIHLSMMQSVVGQLEVAVRQDPEWRKDALKEREKQHLDKSKQQAAKSTKSHSTASAGSQKSLSQESNEDEIKFAKFKKDFGRENDKDTKSLWRQYRKAVEGWVKVGSPETLAEQQVLDGMIKAGTLKRVS